MVNDDETPKRRSRQRKRPLSPHYKANDEGGFGNPPVSGQFQRGNPGGPGRPSTEQSLVLSMRGIYGSNVPLKNGGEKPYYEAFALAAREATLKRTPASVRFGLELHGQFGPKPFVGNQPQPDFSVLSDLEMVVLAALQARVYAVPTFKSPPSPIGTQFEDRGGILRLNVRENGELSLERIGELSDTITPRIIPEGERCGCSSKLCKFH